MVRAVCIAIALCLFGSACAADVQLGDLFGGGAVGAGGPGDELAWGLALGAEGHVYVVGSFRGTADFGNGPHASVGPDFSAFLASYTREGAPRWARTYGGTQFAFGEHVTAADGRVHLLGYWSGSMETTLGTLDSGTHQALVLLTHDEEGALLSERHFPGAANVQGKGLAEADGIVALGGNYVGDVDLGNGPLGPTPTGLDHGLLAVFAAGSNVPRWSRAIAGDRVLVEGVVARSDGSLIAVGHFGTRIELGVGIVGTAGRDAFVAAFDASGTERWPVHIAATGDAVATFVAAAGTDVVVVGTFAGDADVGGTVLSSAGASDGFILRVADDGRVVWARAIGGAGVDALNSAAVHDGRVLACGVLSGTIEAGGSTLTSAGATDALIVAYDAASGEALNGARIGGSGTDDCRGVAIDPATEEVVVTGRFSGSVEISGAALAAVGATDIYVARLVL